MTGVGGCFSWHGSGVGGIVIWIPPERQRWLSVRNDTLATVGLLVAPVEIQRYTITHKCVCICLFESIEEDNI